MLAVSVDSADAAITVAGPVSPSYVGADPWDVDGRLTVGSSSGIVSGVLEVQDASSVTSQSGVIGYSSFAPISMATVAGAGSMWSNAGDLAVGDRGKGELHIENGGVVNNTNGTIGSNYGNGISGTVSVTGQDSSWNNTGNLYLNSKSQGLLHIAGGGRVNVIQDTRVGLTLGTNTIDFDNGELHTGGLLASNEELTGVGTIYTRTMVGDINLAFDAVSGLQPSIVLNSLPGQNISIHFDATAPEYTGTLGAGYRGTGSLLITDGLVLSSAGGEIGYYGNSNGTATITGPGSAWSSTGHLYLGRLGTGTMYVTNGAEVTNQNGYIGYVSGASGAAIVSGAGSVWHNLGILKVGDRGSASLTVEQGGRVISADAELGSPYTVATINGADSRWDINGNLTFSGSLQELRLQNGGTVSVNHNTYGPYYSTPTNGVIRFDGGILDTGGLLIAPDELTGSGTIYTSGLVSDVDLVFDAASGLTQQIVLNGLPGQDITINLDNSRADKIGSMGAGYKGQGSLIIKDQLTVSSIDSYLGYASSSSGTATVTGHSAWLNSGHLYVGRGGGAYGELLVEDGSLVANDGGFIGGYSGGEGIVTISGEGSAWSNAGILYIGSGGGKGTLNIENGAVVSVGNGIVLAFDAADYIPEGTINLSGGVLDLNGTGLEGDGGIATVNFTGGVLKNAASIHLWLTQFIQSGGTLAPGGPIGQTDILSDYNLTAGTLEIELGGPGNPIDLVTATGDIDISILGTTIDLRALGSMAAGTYTVLESTGGTITGMFENVSAFNLFGVNITVLNTGTAITVTLDSDLVFADPNTDGFVGIADLNIVLGNWNQTVTPGDILAGDLNGDGYVGIEDLNAILGNWNDGTPPVDVTAAIPEPGTVGMLALGAVCCFRSRAVFRR